MKDFTLYDVLGVLAPGTVVTVGVVTLYPETAVLLTQKDFSIGDFGLIVLISYVAGNLVAALGNLIEIPYWKMRGGNPTDRARKSSGNVLTSREQDAVQDKLRGVEMIGAQEEIRSLKTGDWWSLGRRIYSYVEARAMIRRIDVFNAQYGMNRGIAAGFVALIIMLIIRSGFTLWRTELILAGCAALAVYRMDRFSRYYASELFRQFLVAPAQPVVAKPSDDAE
jgi:hypothetical protein